MHYLKGKRFCENCSKVSECNSDFRSKYNEKHDCSAYEEKSSFPYKSMKEKWDSMTYRDKLLVEIKTIIYYNFFPLTTREYDVMAEIRETLKGYKVSKNERNRI